MSYAIPYRPVGYSGRRRAHPLSLLGLLAALSSAAAGTPGMAAGSGSCASNLTCAPQGRVTSAKDFVLEVPDLSAWQRVVPDVPQARPTSLAAPVVRDATTGMELVLIPAACWLRGPAPSTSPARDGASEPGRKVCVESFYIGAHEVTFEAYDRFAQATSRKLPEDEGFGRGPRPVINVNLYDALSFAKWLSRQSGARYRLPTEVEWEHAARAGSTTAFPWGEEIDTNRANCDGCGSPWDGVKTAPVGSFAPNAWGLYDVIGNVGEWTCSMRDPDPARSFESCDSPYETRRRAYRNGGWSDEPERLAASFRDWNAAMRRTDFVGFRLVRECEECGAPPPAPRSGRLADQETIGEAMQ